VTRKRLGYFSRLLDEVSPAERYRLGTEQIRHAESCGFDAAWVAQHHFSETEGGMPSPLVFLAQVAARTTTIRIGTGIITLPMENAVRIAEDSTVLDLMSGGRLEVGVGPGGTPSSFASFGQDSARRNEIFESNLAQLKAAWRGERIGGVENRLYPASPSLGDRVWQATFSVAGGRRAGLAGDGLLLSRTQPRPDDQPELTLSDIQNPIIDAYLAALPAGRAPRILASRSMFVADDRAEARHFAQLGLRRFNERLKALGRGRPDESLEVMLKAADSHVGTPEDVIATLSADTALARATDMAFQVHSMDPPHPFILRSIELTASKVAPALGWVREEAEPMRLAAAG
jgi:putative FMN-dependent luciferase-like monooxygenase